MGGNVWGQYGAARGGDCCVFGLLMAASLMQGSGPRSRSLTPTVTKAECLLLTEYQHEQTDKHLDTSSQTR